MKYILFSIILSLVKFSDELKCYECSSLVSPVGCSSPFDEIAPNVLSIDCDPTLFSKCFTMRINVDNTKVTLRGCGLANCAQSTSTGDFCYTCSYNHCNNDKSSNITDFIFTNATTKATTTLFDTTTPTTTKTTATTSTKKTTQMTTSTTKAATTSSNSQGTTKLTSSATTFRTNIDICLMQFLKIFALNSFQKQWFS